MLQRQTRSQENRFFFAMTTLHLAMPHVWKAVPGRFLPATDRSMRLGSSVAERLTHSQDPLGCFLHEYSAESTFEPTQAATVINLDRDICLVVDRSSSMKLYLNEMSPTMSTGDARFCNLHIRQIAGGPRFRKQFTHLRKSWS